MEKKKKDLAGSIVQGLGLGGIGVKAMGSVSIQMASCMSHGLPWEHLTTAELSSKIIHPAT